MSTVNVGMNSWQSGSWKRYVFVETMKIITTSTERITDKCLEEWRPFLDVELISNLKTILISKISDSIKSVTLH